MEEYKQRAEKAEALLNELENRVAQLEKCGGSSGSGQLKQSDKQRLKAAAYELQAEAEKLEKENEDLKRVVANLKKGGSSSGGSDTQRYKEVFQKVSTEVKQIREEASKLESENETLKKQIESMKTTSAPIGNDERAKITKRLQDLKIEVQKLVDENATLKASVSSGAPAATAVTRVVQTIDTVEVGADYYVTSDMAELKREWEVAELGPLDDEDFQKYVGEFVKVMEIEDDDDTVKVRFDNHSTQWFPISALYGEGSAAAAAPEASGNVQKLSYNDIELKGEYVITGDLAELKKEWEVAELGPMDDEDFEKYLNEPVVIMDLEEDDETVQVRFENHNTQWMPASALYGVSSGGSKPTAAKEESDSEEEDSSEDNVPTGPVWLDMKTCKVGQEYQITNSLKRLRKEWDEAEIGPIDDEDLVRMLGEEVKVLEVEEDDETASVRLLSTANEKWVPIFALAVKGTVDDRKPIPKLNYFNILGRASKLRLTLHDLDVAFVDNTNAYPDKTKLAFGQLPSFECDGRTYVQSNAILRFIGRKYMAYGEDEDTTDVAIEAVVDWESAYHRVIYTDKGSDESKAAFLKAMQTPKGEASGNEGQFENFDQFLSSLPNTYIGGSNPSIADYYLYDLCFKIRRLYSNVKKPFNKVKTLQEWYKAMNDRAGLSGYLRGERCPKNTNANGIGN